MLLNAIAPITVFLYLLAAGIQTVSLLYPLHRIKQYVAIIAIAAIVLHALLLHVWIDRPIGQDLNFCDLFSLASWLIALIVLIVAMRRPIGALFIFIFPVCAASIVLIRISPRPILINTLADPLILFHILLGVLTFCVLCFAGLLAILLAIQEYCLRCKKLMRLMSQLPALESMENLLFQIIRWGFILLTLVLFTSFYFYHATLFAKKYLVQKTMLATTAWFVFAWLLLGRYLQGWSGRKAIYGTLFAVFLLVVSYYGSQYVL